MGEGVKYMPIQYCLWIAINGWQEGVWCFVPLEEQQGYHDVVSPLLAEFSISSIDFYPPKDELHGKRQQANQRKTQYLLNVTLRDLFLSKVLVHKYQCIEVAHAPVQQFIWHSWVKLV